MENLVEITGLSKRYGKKEVLSNVNINLKPGSIVGLLGPNGSGKTTLLKVMCGLLKDYDGSVLIDGKPVGAYTKSIVSYLPDTPYYANWMKVKDLIQVFVDMYADFDLQRALELLQRFSIGEKDSIKTMSKGTVEKLQLALTMSRDARLIVLDEPIGGVDPATREVILDTILTNYNDKQTLLIATHLISDIERIFDSVLFIKQGSIVLDKNVEDIRSETGKSINDLFIQEFR